MNAPLVKHYALIELAMSRTRSGVVKAAEASRPPQGVQGHSPWTHCNYFGPYKHLKVAFPEPNIVARMVATKQTCHRQNPLSSKKK